MTFSRFSGSFELRPKEPGRASGHQRLAATAAAALGKDNDSQLSLFVQPKEAEQVITEAYGEEGGVTVSVGVPMFGGMPDSVGAST